MDRFNSTRHALAIASSVSVFAVTALGLAAGARAQTADSPTGSNAPASGSDQLQEVVVTAERRSESQQTTPIAVTVISGDQLEGKGIVQMQDLQNAAPSLSITPSGLTANVNIRGIGLDSGSPSVVPGVATYRDGLWQPPIVTTDTFYDMGSVEVLRGPQGTFVGSNSTGGAVFLNSRDPDLKGWSGNIEFQGANYSDVGVRGGINLPISDTWAARVAFDEEQRDSFYREVTTQLTPSPELFGHPGSLDEKNVRLGLLGKPNEDLNVLLKVEINDKSTGGYAYKPVPGTTYAPFASPDPFVLNYDHDSQNDELGARASLKIDWDIAGSGIVLRSLTGDQFMRVHNIYDIDATSSTLPSGPPALWNTQAIIERPITQEFNLISPDTGRVQWIVGGYYLHDIREVALDVDSQAIPNVVYVNGFDILQSAAAFGQVSYNITDALQVQAGLRYTHDWNESPSRANVTVDLGIPGVPLIVNSLAGIETDSATTGKVALNWKLNKDNFLYAFVAKGFKAGGYNAGGAAGPQTNFAPEVVWDYEIGWKADFLDNHVRTDLGAFWNNYTDLQVQALNTGTGQSSLVNSGKSAIKGAEFELHGLIAGFKVDAGAAYVSSRIGAVTLVNTEALPPGTSQPQCGPGQAPPGMLQL